VSELLGGGVANEGAVSRVGEHVRRPSNPYSSTIHRLLLWLRAAGFDGAPVPIGIVDDGHERLQFIDGDVPVPPYPAWAQTDAALESVAVLLRRFHDASSSFDASGLGWSGELADPLGGPVICHNDVCLENVVFREGVAFALLDFDFAAPGRRMHDLAHFARMCVPVDDDASTARLGWGAVDRPARLRLVADAYGADSADRVELVAILTDSIAQGGEFVRRRAEAGDPGFVKMWREIGGMERFERRRRWFTHNMTRFEQALR
jgi:Phosphotransferase enzyme family